MGLMQRARVYEELEQRRERPLIVYVTSTKPNAEGQIAGDAVHEIELQLEALPSSTEALDLFVVSNGGDPTVAWRIVSLIRERVKQLSVLIPAGAFSAATLIALGADSIVIHANGNLGPVDPQIRARRRGPREGEEAGIEFGAEDLSAFLTYARETVGLTDQQHLLQVFSKFCDQVGAVPIGVAARSAQLSLALAEQLLMMHMSEGRSEQRAKTIAEKLSREFYHHGYALSRREAKQIGLPVEDPDPIIDDLIWKLWLDFVADLAMREPFHPLGLAQSHPECKRLFSDVPSFSIPPGTPPQLAQQIAARVAQDAVVRVPPAPYTLTQACIESRRLVTHFVTEGAIFVARLPDFRLKYEVVPYRFGWREMPVPKHRDRGAVGSDRSNSGRCKA